MVSSLSKERQYFIRIFEQQIDKRNTSKHKRLVEDSSCPLCKQGFVVANFAIFVEIKASGIFLGKWALLFATWIPPGTLVFHPG
jgi:hypothetical protein